jgi:hypothetical protein
VTKSIYSVTKMLKGVIFIALFSIAEHKEQDPKLALTSIKKYGGILMEWLKKLIEKHTKDGKLDTEAFMDEVKTEFPKVAVPKDTFNALTETKKKLEKDIQERDGQLEELKKTAGASEELKKQIETLQAENKAATEKFAADLKDLTLTNAIKLAIAGKVHDEDLTAGLIDKSKLVVDGDKVVGLDEQLKGLQEEKAFLFKPAGEGENKPGFQPRVGSDGKGNNSDDKEQPASLRDAIASHLKQNLGT